MKISEKILSSFKATQSIKATAREAGCSWMRVVKILSSNGVVINDTHEKILSLAESGKDAAEIASQLSLSEKTVKAYLPAVRPVYGEDLTKNAKKIRKCRERKREKGE